MIQLFQINQATSAIFPDLYFSQTTLIFIQAGSKQMQMENQPALSGQQGDLLVFAPGSEVTLQNRPLKDSDYRATGLSFSDELVSQVFPDQGNQQTIAPIQVVPGERHAPLSLLAVILDTLANENLPDVIRQNRLLEPLLWLSHLGYRLQTPQAQPMTKVRQLIETDLSHPWSSKEVAAHFAMSEATMRRWLAKSGHGFAKILLNTRLENALAVLLTSDRNINEVALDCGFKTPSHFSEAFKTRFGITPRAIRVREK